MNFYHQSISTPRNSVLWFFRSSMRFSVEPRRNTNDLLDEPSSLSLSSDPSKTAACGAPLSGMVWTSWEIRWPKYLPKTSSGNPSSQTTQVGPISKLFLSPSPLFPDKSQRNEQNDLWWDSPWKERHFLYPVDCSESYDLKSLLGPVSSRFEYLIGGFNPIEKYVRQIGSFP